MWKKIPTIGNQGNMSKEGSSDGIRNLLGNHVGILLKYPVKLELKGDKTENRMLVFCPCRLFCVKIPHPRIDFHFHYLEIQAIESRKPNQLILTANEKSHSFIVSEPDEFETIDKMLITLLTAITDTFPGIPLGSLIRKMDVVPVSRLAPLDYCLDRSSCDFNSVCPAASSTPHPCTKSKSTSSLSEEPSVLISSASSSSGVGGSGSLDRSVASPAIYRHFTLSKWDASGTTSSPCGGFSTQYAWMCDLHGLPYREEVAWDVDTIYLSHDSRELCLRDFDHLEQRDSVPILSAMEYNTWFKALRLSSVKLSHDAIERFFQIIRKSVSIEELYLDNIGAKTDFVLKLSSALSNNSNSQVHTLDLAHNMIEDKGAIHLSNSLAKLCRGPISLNFSYCGLSTKGVAQLAHALVVNRAASKTLTYFNLSGNSLKDDINNLCNFLAQPNVVTILDLSGTDCTLETVFGALLRGCTSHLATLNLSKNNFATKKGKEIPPSFKQFLTSSLALKHLSLSSCKLSLDALKQLLLGLACNESAGDVELDVSSNSLGAQGGHILESCLPGIKCLSSLDISDNNLEGELALIVNGASKNKSLKHLNLGRNLHSSKAKHVAQVMESIVQVLQDEDCVLESLSLADSKLKGELYSVINALGSNQCIQNINISGNQIGDVGARLLAKALQINSKLRCITYDKNNITIQGFGDIAYGLESNTNVRYMPFPVYDSTACMKVSAEKTETVMKKIQDLVVRNSQPKKATNGHQAFRLQQGFLLSSAQQTVDKLTVQIQESIKQLRNEDAKEESEDVVQKELITQAENLILDSEKAKQLVLNLHEILEHKCEGGKPLESKLQEVADELQAALSEQVQGNIEQVVKMIEEKCPKIFSSEVKADIKDGCLAKSKICQDFVRKCIVDVAGTDIINKLNEVHLGLAAHISDKLVDTVIDALVKCQKQLNDLSKKRSSTPDVLRNRVRSSPSDTTRETGDMSIVFGDNSHLLSDLSPMATPQMHAKRRGFHGRRIRPKSVVDCIEGISADDIPDLLPSLPSTIEETISNLVELPPVSPQQLKHLVKARPKKPKTRAPTRPCIRQSEPTIEISDLQDGLDTFFRPGSTTPTAVATPDSDECSTSLMISSMTSVVEEPSLISTATNSSRTFKAEESNSEKTSPTSFETCSAGSKLSLDAVPRSKSTDCIEKPGPKSLLTPTHQQRGNTADLQRDSSKSPIPKLGVSVGPSVLAEIKVRQEKRGSTILSDVTHCKFEEKSNASISISGTKEKFLGSKNSLGLGFVSRRPPPVAPKPRPWSAVGSDRRSGEFSLGSDGLSPNASPANTPDSGDLLDENGPPVVETVSLLPPNLSAVSSVISSNAEESPKISIDRPLFGGRGNGSGMSLLGSSPGKVHADSSHCNGPVSLPSMSGVIEGRQLGWSVKDMAASLTRHNNTEEKTKRSDSLPRNASPPTTTATPTPDILRPLPHHAQEPTKARVSVQEWNRHHSVGEWRAPLKKVSAELANRSISKRWEVSSEQKS